MILLKLSDSKNLDKDPVPDTTNDFDFNYNEFNSDTIVKLGNNLYFDKIHCGNRNICCVIRQHSLTAKNPPVIPPTGFVGYYSKLFLKITSEVGPTGLQ